MSLLDLLGNVLLSLIGLLPMALMGIAAWLVIPADIWQNRRVLSAMIWLAMLTLLQVGLAALFGDYSWEAYVLLLPVVALLLLWAIRGRWSAKWPLIFVLVALSPLSVLLTAVVGMIGCAKLIIWAIGRGNNMSGSQMREPKAAAPPKGLVE